jgi:hypothetical protein
VIALGALKEARFLRDRPIGQRMPSHLPREIITCPRSARALCIRRAHSDGRPVFGVPVSASITDIAGRALKSLCEALAESTQGLVESGKADGQVISS